MVPFGDYSRLVSDLNRREEQDIPITFGLLIADYRQTKSQEYIINYLERFHDKSGKYINFYIPGYFEKNMNKLKQNISIAGVDYYFDEKKYSDFLTKLEIDFGFEYFYNPTLILMEYDKGNFKTTRRMVIELDDQGRDISKTGQLFEELFEIAKFYVDIEDFSRELRTKDIKEGLFTSFLNALNNSFIKELHGNYERYRKYKL